MAEKTKKIEIIQPTENTKGWFWAHPNKKRHYFVDGESLCKKFKIPGGFLHLEAKDVSNNCPECMTAIGQKFSPEDVVEKPVEIPKRAFHKKKPK